MYNLHWDNTTLGMVKVNMAAQRADVAYPQAATFEDIACNLAAVRERIATTCARAGRAPPDVRLLPVSKTVDEARIRLVHAVGCRELGENKVQEALHKCHALSGLEGLCWSVIGRLQSNKAKYVARFAAEFQALDSLRVAEELDRCLQREARALDVFVQVNASGKPANMGCRRNRYWISSRYCRRTRVCACAD